MKLTKKYAVHGNDGTSHLTWAANEVKRTVPGATVTSTRYTGERDEAGALVVEVHYVVPDERHEWCPAPGCAFEGLETEVDEHRLIAHGDEPQYGSNLRHRPRDGATS